MGSLRFSSELLMTKTGALLIGHARLENLEKQIEKLSKFETLEIFVWIDKGTTPGLITLQFEFIKNLNSKILSPANIHLTESNLGLAKSIPAAISWMFESVDQGIILEDDLEFGDSFIEFTLYGLREFHTNSKIWMVAGSNPLNLDSLPNHQIAITTYPVIWGWGTWKSRWLEIENYALNSLAAPKNHMSCFRVRRYWKNGWYKTRLGVLNSWANIVAGYQHDLGKITVMPPVNLIKNNGNDGIGVHDNSNLYVSRDIQHIVIGDITWEIPSSDRIAMTDLKFEQEIFFVRSASILNSYLCYVRFKLKSIQKLFRLGEK